MHTQGGPKCVRPLRLVVYVARTPERQVVPLLCRKIDENRAISDCVLDQMASKCATTMCKSV